MIVLYLSTIFKYIHQSNMSLKDKRKAFQNQLKQGETIAGKYEVLQQLGQGVSSVVIKARNIKTN